jgi:chromosome partitioning protein
LSEVTRALLLVADLALLPCGPSALDVRAVQDAIRVVRQAQKIREGPPRALLVPNKLQTNYRLSRELLETAEQLGIPSLEGLKLRQAYADAVGQGSVVWRLPRTEDAADELAKLFDQISRHEKEITQ